ncbi:hypothetical protein, variant 2 [Aphanomyces invadans]|uniref:WRKY19-like zinc finger domain-containing protein n=1 Tax=Aphanomyces invadans TaxID=157072 RepID=A0A024TTI9_9STRA|nr:hypothetical protein, variant 2 [Aphanomyces invadans]XP_008874048.1 hypothetical protein, variant 1 [Aphanomyces invadans]ETV97339.1 hypothetical protein, variant 1 [Aphanomyces invadans]ETV97340.1 hypothetical protein, variant 2 [Aphanomyces invadans]|eukprot:XP_008874046.1 hypothetical protein, variant 2 [Aphanomyces invadans]
MTSSPSSALATCVFKDCSQPVHSSCPTRSKCLFHRNRSRCEAPDCSNQAYARNRCVRHGAKQSCVADGCTQNRRLGLYCSKHADANSKKRCSVHGCDKLPHARGLCVRHGGGRLCKAPDCASHARIGLLCARHFHGLTSPSTSPRSTRATTSATSRCTSNSTTDATFSPSLHLSTLTDLTVTMGMPDTLDWAILSDLVSDSNVHTTTSAASNQLNTPKCWGDAAHSQKDPQPHNTTRSLHDWDSIFNETR